MRELGLRRAVSYLPHCAQAASIDRPSQMSQMSQTATLDSVETRSQRTRFAPDPLRLPSPQRVWSTPPACSLPAAEDSWAQDWFRHALIYQVRVDAFADGRGLGHGDLQGIADHLDHIASLSNCLWLSPVCASPMRDGGYDVADYTHVDPRFGTDAQLDALIDRCHARGMRVIVEMVANHASTDHPWFVQESLYRKSYLQWQALNLPADAGRALLTGGAAQTPAEVQAEALITTLLEGPQARAATEAGYYTLPDQLARLSDLLYGTPQAQAASRQGDFFLWTQTPEAHFREAFLAFPDDYQSVWERDPASGSFYYHSFFAHQADLNYRSPRMRATMETIIRHWAQRGADGLRIDAAPFLLEGGRHALHEPPRHACAVSRLARHAASGVSAGDSAGRGGAAPAAAEQLLWRQR